MYSSVYFFVLSISQRSAPVKKYSKFIYDKNVILRAQRPLPPYVAFSRKLRHKNTYLDKRSKICYNILTVIVIACGLQTQGDLIDSLIE